MPAVRDAALPVATVREDGLPVREVRDMPEPPSNYWRLVGPGIVAGGVGLSSGEFVLWPYIASQVGLVLLWGAMIGVVTQFFLNMEVERYTLATGETAVTGFNRFWRHWGLVFAVMAYFANLWPGWAISSATLASYLFGGSPTIIAVISLLVIGFALTFAPVIYVALERLIFVKVAAVLVLVVLGVAFAIEPESWQALPAGFAGIGELPEGLSVALVFGAIAFAGSGGAQNLCQSNWIRDKGFGMGQYVPRLVSPVTGAPEAKDLPATSYIFETDADEHGAVAKLVAVRQRRAGIQLRARHGCDDRPDVAACALDAVRRAESSEQRLVPENRGAAARANGRAVVWRAVPGRRRLLALRIGHGHHRLHQPSRRRHPEDHLRAGRVGEPHVFLARVGNGRTGMHDSPGRHVSAAHAARHFRLDRRNHDVSLLVSC